MEQLKYTKFKYKFCFLSGVITGILIGTSALTIKMSYRIDTYYENLAYLENTIEDKNARLEKLENTINTQNLILEDIEIIISFEGDEIDRIEIEKNINVKYSSLLGKEVESIDADIIAEVIDNRIFQIEDREYKLHVDKLILTEILKIWVEVEIIT